MTLESIAIAGPGRMGIGIATAVLMAGPRYSVTLIDTKKRAAGKTAEALENARVEIMANLELLERLGVMYGDIETAAERLDISTSLVKSAAGRTLVFEALPEKMEVKREFFHAVDPLMVEETIIASATSTFHLGEFREMCSRPGNILCAHWLNPAFLIPLVEVAHTDGTHEWARVRLDAFLRDIGKIPLNMRSSPGFVVPRIQAAAMNEAIRILEEGVTTAEEIDTAIKAGFGFRLGALGLIEFVDLGGVDILYHAGGYLHAKLGGEHFKPPGSVVAKMDADAVGPRAGRGFYDYENVDTRALFEQKYKAFVELLRLYDRSKYLSFAGGIAREE